MDKCRKEFCSNLQLWSQLWSPGQCHSNDLMFQKVENNIEGDLTMYSRCHLEMRLLSSAPGREVPDTMIYETFSFVSSMIAPKQFQKLYSSPNDLTFSWNHFVGFGWPTEYWPTDKPTGNLGHEKSKSESCWSYLVGEQSCLLSSPSKVLVLAANINMDFSGASFLSISRQGVGCWCCRQPMCMCFQNINLVFRF